MRIIINMPRSNRNKTMTELLREALAEVESLRAVARDAGLDQAALSRFAKGKQSLRLDLADKLAAYFGIECTRKGR